MNNSSKQHREKVFFRIIGFSLRELEMLRIALPDVDIEERQRRGRDDFVVSVELSSPEVSDNLRRVFTEGAGKPKVPYGLYVSLVTDRDSDGVSLQPFICDFWREIGGALDFSFTVV